MPAGLKFFPDSTMGTIYQLSKITGGSISKVHHILEQYAKQFISESELKQIYAHGDELYAAMSDNVFRTLGMGTDEKIHILSEALGIVLEEKIDGKFGKGHSEKLCVGKTDSVGACYALMKFWESQDRQSSGTPTRATDPASQSTASKPAATQPKQEVTGLARVQAAIAKQLKKN